MLIDGLPYMKVCDQARPCGEHFQLQWFADEAKWISDKMLPSRYFALQSSVVKSPAAAAAAGRCVVEFSVVMCTIIYVYDHLQRELILYHN